MDPIEDDDGPMGFKDSEWERHTKTAGRIGTAMVVVLLLVACLALCLAVTHLLG